MSLCWCVSFSLLCSTALQEYTYSLSRAHSWFVLGTSSCVTELRRGWQFIVWTSSVYEFVFPCASLRDLDKHLKQKKKTEENPFLFLFCRMCLQLHIISWKSAAFDSPLTLSSNSLASTPASLMKLPWSRALTAFFLNPVDLSF